MGVEVGIVVPHAPVLLLDRRPELDVFRRSAKDAATALDRCEAVILLSPHGDGDGVYRETRGNLDDFGVDGIEVDVQSDAVLSTDVAEAWGRPAIEDAADHGVVGALALVTPGTPVVACTIAEITGPFAGSTVENAIESGYLFADALQQVAGGRRIGLMISAHSAASLTPKAPLALRPEGKELDDLILDCLATDCGSLARVDPALWREAGACGAGPLTALGVLFEGSRADVFAYDHPFGVGYLVAATSHG